MKLTFLALFSCVLLGWIAAPHLPPGFAAEPETPDASESEPATAEETVTADDTATTDGEPAVDSTCTCGTFPSASPVPRAAELVASSIRQAMLAEWIRGLRSLILGRLWFEVEYLAWASSRTHLPPLVTTSDPTASPEEAGVLGMDNTSILFGNADYHGDLPSGGRLTGGYWFTPEHRFGVEGSYFQVDVGKAEFADVGDATPDWVHTVDPAKDGQSSAVPVSFPGVQLVSIAVKSDVDLLGAEALLRRAIREGGNYRLDGVAGYRYQRLLDRLSVMNTSILARTRKPAQQRRWIASTTLNPRMSFTAANWG